MAKYTEADLYGILAVSHAATKKEIVKAYRQQARKCHPDKNPDNPKAAELFHELTKALEILTDAAARAAYDKTLKAKQAAELRHKELDSKRKKFKEDLEAREQAAQNNKDKEEKLARNLQQEIERLRKEGSRLVEEEKERLDEELQKEQERRREERENAAEPTECPQSPSARLKLRWKAKKSDTENGGYSQDILMDKFSPYGEVTALIVSSKKNGSAIIEYSNSHAAILAVQNETGLPGNPLTLTWLSGQPDVSDASVDPEGDQSTGSGATSTVGPERCAVPQSQFTVPPPKSALPPSQSDDFESLVLRRMRQTEERKRLIDQMNAEDEGT